MVFIFEASLALRRLRDYETTRLQDYEWLPRMLRSRSADYKTTRLQDYETTSGYRTTSCLVVSLTSCLGVA